MSDINQRVLDAPMGENDADAATVRDYMVLLVAGVWRWDEEFNGKRPFGNSGWKYEVYRALAEAGLIAGEKDEDGDMDVPDEERRKGDQLVADAIQSMRVQETQQ